MFNLQGSELVIILLLALVVLGPEKLPDAMRKAGQFYAELKKMSSGFQEEFRAVVDEPLRELRETANTIRDSADFTKLQNGERPEKPKSAEMLAAPDPDEVPTDDLPFAPDRDELASGAVESGPAAPIEPSEQPPFSSVIVSGGAGSAPTPSTDSDVGDDTGPEPAAEAVATENPPKPAPFSGAQQSSAAPRDAPEPAKPFSGAQQSSAAPRPAPEPAKPFSGAQQSSAAPRPPPEPTADPVEVGDAGVDTDQEDPE